MSSSLLLDSITLDSGDSVILFDFKKIKPAAINKYIQKTQRVIKNNVLKTGVLVTTVITRRTTVATSIPIPTFTSFVRLV